MVTSKQIKEKIRDYRRAFKHNWDLFKENKVGLFGLAIMMMFILIALISPFMGLRDPIQWMAPDSDVLKIGQFFEPATNGIVTTSLTPRVLPMSYGSEQLVDRLYYAGGTSSTSYTEPYGIYAKKVNDAGRAWTQGGGLSGAFQTNSMVTTGVEGVNFGSVLDFNQIDYWLFFGCEDGTFYAINDQLINEVVPDKNSDLVWSEQLDGPVAGFAVYKVSVGASASYLDYNDRVYVSTQAGSLYAFRGELDLNGDFVGFEEFWNITGISNVTMTSPALTGPSVYVGSRDGVLYGFDAMTGLPVGAPYNLYDPLYDDEASVSAKRNYWSNDPFAATSRIVATTDDGRIHVLDADTSMAQAGWEGGYKLDRTLGDLDLGNLTNPHVRGDGQQILFGSDSGYAYRLEITPRADSTESKVKTAFDSTLSGTFQTSCVAPPYYDEAYLDFMYIPTQNFNGTPTDYSDDFTMVYAINTNGTVTYRKSIDGVALGQPIIYDDIEVSGSQHLGQGEIAFTTVMYEPDGTMISGVNARMYSFSAGGQMITPLPPTWALSQEQKDDYWPGEEQQPPSGNSYFMGTDDQGRDILSQTLLGSRIALLVGFAAAIFSISIGLLVGLVSGYYGGNVDTILMRFTDVILVLPGLPLLIILAALMDPSIWNIVFIIGIVGWGGTARIIRSEVLTLKERPFIDSARVTGASKARIMFWHIAPNILPLAVLYMTFYVSGAILSEAALAFIGLGDPRTMSWGMMLNYVQHTNALQAWWWLLPPGICITLICLAFFLLGRAFDEIVNPRLRRRQ